MANHRKTSLNKKIFIPIIFFLSIEEEKHMSLKNNSDKKNIQTNNFLKKETFLQQQSDTENVRHIFLTVKLK